MKNVKLLATVMIMAMTTVSSSVSGQADTNENNSDFEKVVEVFKGWSVEGWSVAEFTGTYKGKKVYDVMYERDIYAKDNLVYLRVCLLYSKYGRDNYYATGVPTNSTAATFMYLEVDIQRDRYSYMQITDVTIQGEKTTSNYDPPNVSWEYPKIGSVGDYYVKLARKLANNY